MGSDDGSGVLINKNKLMEHTKKYTKLCPTTIVDKQELTEMFRDIYVCVNPHGYVPNEYIIAYESSNSKTSGELVERLKMIENEYLN